MKNSDKPSAPFKEVISMQGGVVTRYDNHKGLTKREHFAAIAMQGLLANSSIRFSYPDLASESVDIADKLLLALEK